MIPPRLFTYDDSIKAIEFIFHLTCKIFYILSLFVFVVFCCLTNIKYFFINLAV